MMQVKRWKGWRMSCDVGEVMERWRMSSTHCIVDSSAHSPTFPLLHLHHSSFCNPPFASPRELLRESKTTELTKSINLTNIHFRDLRMMKFLITQGYIWHVLFKRF